MKLPTVSVFVDDQQRAVEFYTGPLGFAVAADGIPYLVLGVDDVATEHARLRAAGVVFTQPPVEMGPVITAVLDDTVGNLVQLAQFTG